MKRIAGRAFVMIMLALLPLALGAEKYKITRLNTPTLKVGGKLMKTGDVFDDRSTIGWTDADQSVEVRNMSTGALYRFSKRVFASHGGVTSIKDYFLSLREPDKRKASSDLEVKRSEVRDSFPERRLALVIGNSNYANMSFLRNAQKDASDVSSKLKQLGFDVIESYECTSSQFHTALNKFASMSDNYDMTLFYYAGHGLQEDGKNYLVPIESKLEYKSELGRMLNADDVVQRMESTKSKSRVIVLDACRNAKKSWTRSASEGLARMEGGAGSVIVFSTQSGKEALDGEGDNSPFAIAFMNNIIKPEMDFPVVMTEVVRDTYRMTSNRQTPLRVGDLLEKFVFNPGGKKLAAMASVDVPSAGAAAAAKVTPPATPAAPAMTPPKVRMSSDDVDVKVESCELKNGNAYLNLRITNKTSSAMRGVIWDSQYFNGKTTETAIYDTNSRLYRYRNLDITVGENFKHVDFFEVFLPVGLPVRVTFKMRNVADNTRGLSRASVAFRGVDSKTAYGTAILTITDIPFGYKDPSASVSDELQETTLDFDVEDIDVKVTKAKRTGDKVKFDLILTNTSLDDKTPTLSNGTWNNNETAVYDSEGRILKYHFMGYDNVKVFQDGERVFDRFTLPSGIPVRLKVVVDGYKAVKDKVIPVFTMLLRGANGTDIYEYSVLKITNIPIR